VGAGTGNSTGDFVAAFANVVSTDLSREMLALASRSCPRVLADASSLPFRAASVAVVALVNMFLFPSEVARVLEIDGVLLWVSTNGDATPIYLTPLEVLEAFHHSDIHPATRVADLSVAARQIVEICRALAARDQPQSPSAL
jgi:ubiquinone/menaquinone biosynthesis C-methylase UbiE